MIVAVDTGGTKTLVAVFNESGELQASTKFATPHELPEYTSTLRAAIDELVATQSIDCISIGLPGTIQDGVMVWAGNLPWHGVDMKQLLGDHFTCPIIVENDANLAGLAEAKALQKDTGTCLYITVSTGIGTGVVVDGQILPALSRSEGGQIVLRRNGELARWESFASGKAIHEQYNQLASEITDEDSWNQIADNIAAGLMVLCPVIRPEVVVLGGSVGAHFDKFCTRLSDTLSSALDEVYIPEIVQAHHPEEAVVYGCYYYAHQQNSA